MLEGTIQLKEVNYIHEKRGNNNLTPAKPKEKHSHNNNNNVAGIKHHCSLISLNIYGLNSPRKRHRQTEWM